MCAATLVLTNVLVQLVMASLVQKHGVFSGSKV